MIVSAQSQTGDEVEAVQLEDGTIRRLGYTASGKGLYAAPRYGATLEIMDPKDYQYFDNRRPNVPILDQGQVGSCVGHGAARTLMLARDAMGQNFQLLSASFMYALINNGYDRGSDPSDAMAKMQATGFCLDSQLPEGFYIKNDLAMPMFGTAARFKAAEGSYYSASTWGELATAIQERYFAFFTLKVAGNWQRLNAIGVPPCYKGRGNHCMSAGEGFVKLPDGRPAIMTAQSWGKWGLNGYCNITEDFFAYQSDLQIYVVKAPVIDPQDPLAAWPGVG